MFESGIRAMEENMANHKKIGPEEEQRVLSLYEDGCSAALIARELDAHPETVRIFLRSRGLEIRRSGHRKHVGREQREQMVVEYQQGSSTVQIGERLGVEAGTVARYLRLAGVELRPP